MLLLFLLCCAPVLGPCDAMCAAWVEAKGACLADEGLDWEAAGYADQADAADACQTWAWEQRQLATDPAEVDALCAARQEAIPEEIEEGTCAELNALDWSGAPP